MTETTRKKIAELRAQGLFANWTDERVAQMLNRTAGLHARIATTSAEHGNTRQAVAAKRACASMVERCGLGATAQ